MLLDTSLVELTKSWEYISSRAQLSDYASQEHVEAIKSRLISIIILDVESPTVEVSQGIPPFAMSSRLINVIRRVDETGDRNSLSKTSCLGNQRVGFPD